MNESLSGTIHKMNKSLMKEEKQTIPIRLNCSSFSLFHNKGKRFISPVSDQWFSESVVNGSGQGLFLPIWISRHYG